MAEGNEGTVHSNSMKSWTMAALVAAALLCACLGVFAQSKSPQSKTAPAGSAKSPVPKAAAAAEPAKCETCHAAIANTKESDTRHPAMEMGCDSCHVQHALPKPNGKPETPKYLKKAAPELCGDCHDLKERAALKFQHAVANDCTSCHNPHSSPNPKMLVDKQPALCETCHSNQAEAHQKDKFLHKPAFDTGCSTCHDPHASANEHQLRAKGNELCLGCHAQNAGAEAGKPVALFGGSIQLPPNYLDGTKRIAVTINQTKGHPTANHPVSTTKEIPQTKKPMECTTCHNPHSSPASPQFFVTGKKSPSQLCIRCH